MWSAASTLLSRAAHFSKPATTCEGRASAGRRAWSKWLPWAGRRTCTTDQEWQGSQLPQSTVVAPNLQLHSWEACKAVQGQHPPGCKHACGSQAAPAPPPLQAASRAASWLPAVSTAAAGRTASAGAATASHQRHKLTRCWELAAQQLQLAVARRLLFCSLCWQELCALLGWALRPAPPGTAAAATAAALAAAAAAAAAVLFCAVPADATGRSAGGEGWGRGRCVHMHMCACVPGH